MSNIKEKLDAVNDALRELSEEMNAAPNGCTYDVEFTPHVKRKYKDISGSMRTYENPAKITLIKTTAIE